jgi:predicted metal-binding protein
MKSIVMPETVQLTEETKNQLTHEVKETIAEDAIDNTNETFTVSQMWNCHRQMRSASSRLSKWNLN